MRLVTSPNYQKLLFFSWTSWNSITNCSSSRSRLFTHKWIDCDCKAVDCRYCNGDAIKTAPCLPSWSTWENIGYNKQKTICGWIGKHEKKRNNACMATEAQKMKQIYAQMNQRFRLVLMMLQLQMV